MKIFNLAKGWTAVAHFEKTRYGFRHLAHLMSPRGGEVDSAKATYYNRTWESYEFQSVLHKLINSYFKDDKEKELQMEALEKGHNIGYGRNPSKKYKCVVCEGIFSEKQMSMDLSQCKKCASDTRTPKQRLAEYRKNPKTDWVTLIMDYEGGTITKANLLKLFAHLIKTGQAWSLQGSIYGRPAKQLIDRGYISPKGKILKQL